MEKQGLPFGREIEMEIYCDGINIVTRRVDSFVQEEIMLELKATSALNNLNLAQAINYLGAYNLPVGLLINFGNKSLEFKRIYNTKHPANINHKATS